MENKKSLYHLKGFLEEFIDGMILSILSEPEILILFCEQLIDELDLISRYFDIPSDSPLQHEFYRRLIFDKMAHDAKGHLGPEWMLKKNDEGKLRSMAGG